PGSLALGLPFPLGLAAVVSNPPPPLGAEGLGEVGDTPMVRDIPHLTPTLSAPKGGEGALLPWAWALNGAFSVVATPLANLLARGWGFSAVLLVAAGFYAVALLTMPVRHPVSAGE